MNELIVLEQIHLFVEALDGYFNSGTLLSLVFGTKHYCVSFVFLIYFESSLFF